MPRQIERTHVDIVRQQFNQRIEYTDIHAPAVH
jgi:hypothetical protein